MNFFRSPFASLRKDGLTVLIHRELGKWTAGPAWSEPNLYRFLEHSIRSDPDPGYTNKDFPLECTLYLTNSCNSACTYCYSRNFRADSDSRKRMTQDEIRHIVHHVLATPWTRINYFLFGGEPMVAFDLMKFVISEVERQNQTRNKEITFCTTTNGTLVTREHARFLKEKNVRINVSFDGPEWIQNRNRPFAGRSKAESYKAARKGVEALRAEDVKFGITSVVYRPEEMNEIFDFFLRERFTHSIRLLPFAPEGSAATPAGEYADFAVRAAKSHLRIADQIVENNRTSSFKIVDGQLASAVANMTTSDRADLCLRAPCGAADSMIEFHPNGDIVTCDKFYYKGLPPIGRVEDLSETDSLESMLGRSPVIRKLRSRSPDSIHECRNCLYKRWCNGGCTLGSFFVFDSWNAPDVLCEYRKTLFEGLLWRIAERPETRTLLMRPD